MRKNIFAVILGVGFLFALISGNQDALAESLMTKAMDTELLKVSSCPDPDFPEVQCVRHIVWDKESLWSIAREYKTSMETLYLLNPQIAGRRPKALIFVLEELTIPYIPFSEALLGIQIKKLQEEIEPLRQRIRELEGNEVLLKSHFNSETRHPGE